ncbi:MAG TPA: EVE domain-containing protein [Fimbriimonadaceae bacterium]|nr:EVE domain-containing protein [Fimbriimonadaceae bacterium]HRJ34080.1 EVE domain-containing protein [Fimbriimonadaceae bacterium]
MDKMKYWLMKSEPDTYSIDDLEREGVNMWEGCRNYTVRNFFRDQFQIGDRALFYHSNAEPSGIVGEMEVVSLAYPDPTQFDPASDYFDPKSPREIPRWLAVDVRFRRRYPRIIPLAEIRTIPELGAMGVVQRGQRLSVMPVTPEEMRIIRALVGLPAED